MRRKKNIKANMEEVCPCWNRNPFLVLCDQKKSSGQGRDTHSNLFGNQIFKMWLPHFRIKREEIERTESKKKLAKSELID